MAKIVDRYRIGIDSGSEIAVEGLVEAGLPID
jgi:hypothetical protein